MVGRIQLHLLPTIVVLLHDSKTTKKQTKMLAHVVSIDLDTKTRVIMPILQEVVDEIATTLVMHDTSSMPGITDTP